MYVYEMTEPAMKYEAKVIDMYNAKALLDDRG